MRVSTLALAVLLTLALAACTDTITAEEPCPEIVITLQVIGSEAVGVSVSPDDRSWEIVLNNRAVQTYVPDSINILDTHDGVEPGHNTIAVRWRSCMSNPLSFWL